MANLLKVAKVHAILMLREQGWSYRRIGRELGIRRETVAGYVKRARAPDKCGSKPAIAGQAPPGSGPPEMSSIAPGRAQDGPAGVGSASDCEPWREVILAKLEQGLSAKRIHQDLADDDARGSPSYYSVRRFVGRLRQVHRLPYRRMECEAGQECQVDFGSGAAIVVNTAGGRTRRRRPHVLRIVLSHSRKAYSEVVYHQTTENFIRCIENAFWYFGGVPRTLVLDNLRAAVSRADWFDPEINPKVQSFCVHYGIVPLPTKPRMPRHKGKIERGIDYVQDNGLKGHVFDSLESQNRHLLQWERSIADTRIHGTTRKQVGKLFTEVEQPALQPLPSSHGCVGRFPFFHEGQRSVHRDGHVEVDKSYYSVPPEYLGRRVWVRWDGRMVRIFNGRMEQIAVHVKHEPGRFSTKDSHIASEKINGVERGAAKLLDKVRVIGPQAGRWSEAMLNTRGIEGVRVLMGLLSLADRHSSEVVERSCAIAVSHGAYRLRSIRELIKRPAPRQNHLTKAGSTIEFIDEHPIIRSLDDYGRLARKAFTSTTT